MKKIIAILTKKGLLSEGIQENADLNIFNLEGDRVVGYEKVKIENEEHHQFFSLLKSKNVSLLYLDTLTHDLIGLIEKTGVAIRVKEDCENDKFLNTFIFS